MSHSRGFGSYEKLKYIPPPDTRARRAQLLIAAIILLTASVALVYLNLRDEGLRFDSADIQAQFQQKAKSLEEAKNNLRELMSYLDAQAHAMRAYDQTIRGMEAERDKLEPLLKLEEDAVNALFEAQEKRLSSDRWLERILSFVIGVASSVVAAALFNRFWAQSTKP